MRGLGITLLALSLGSLGVSCLWLLDAANLAPSLFSTLSIPVWLTLTGTAIWILVRHPCTRPDPGDALVNVSTLENDIEAILLDSALEEMGVPHVMVSFFDSAYDGTFQAHKGWGLVWGPKRFEEEIREILLQLRENPL